MNNMYSTVQYCKVYGIAKHNSDAVTQTKT